jgi:hypothetical protein
LQEEAGLKADTWAQLGGKVYLSNCFSAEVAYLYIARGLHAVPRLPEVTEILEVRCVPFEEAVRMVDSGEITDAMTVIALARAEKLIKTGQV